MESVEAFFGIIVLAWAVYIVYAVYTVVEKTKSIAFEAERAADTLERVEDALIDLLPDDDSREEN